MLKTAAERLKQKAPLAPAAGEASPEAVKRQERYQNMMKHLEKAQKLEESGIQLSGEETKKLIDAVRKYNDGGNKQLPGGEAQAPGHLEAMCILSRYMPEKDFRSYCRQINKAQGARSPRYNRYEDPEAYPADRLDGSARTAKEWYAESAQRLMKNFTTEGAAEAAAIRLSSAWPPGIRRIRPSGGA